MRNEARETGEPRPHGTPDLASGAASEVGCSPRLLDGREPAAGDSSRLRPRTPWRRRHLNLILLPLVLLGSILPTGDLQAGWKLTSIDRLSLEQAHFKFGGDLVCYTRNGDLFCHDLAAGETTAVTMNLNFLVDIPAAIDGSKVWFCSRPMEGGGLEALTLHDAATGEKTVLHAGSAEIDDEHASADGGRLAVGIEGDIWLWHEGEMEQITATAEESDSDPHLSGDYLVWKKGGIVASMHLPTRQTLALTEPGVHASFLRASGGHAVWVQEASTSEEYRLIIHNRLGTTGTEVVGAHSSDTRVPLHLDGNRLIYVLGTTSQYALVLFDLEAGTLGPVYATGLPMESPMLRGDQVYFLLYNCPSGMCLELNRYDMPTGTLTRVTSFGNTSFVGGYWVGSNAVAILRFLAIPPYDLELLRAEETPGVTCGTTAGRAGGGISANLVLLLVPALGLFRALGRVRRIPAPKTPPLPPG